MNEWVELDSMNEWVELDSMNEWVELDSMNGWVELDSMNEYTKFYRNADSRVDLFNPKLFLKETRKFINEKFFSFLQ